MLSVGRSMIFVLLNMPHNFVWELHEEQTMMRDGRKNKKIFCNIFIFKCADSRDKFPFLVKT